jgi:hypothetical protein
VLEEKVKLLMGINENLLKMNKNNFKGFIQYRYLIENKIPL